MDARIVVGVDGSDHALRAVEWCAANARALDAEVIVVHAIEVPTYRGFGPPYIWLKSPTPEEREARRDLVARDWCKLLANAGVPFRVVLVEGEPAPALMEVARAEDAALVVTGRRGHSAVKKLLLGSTSHYLSHHLNRPLVIVP
jgi:nucleotide-binding universal stress UspA family protein